MYNDSQHNNKGDTKMIQVPKSDIDDYDLAGKDYELTVKNSTTTHNFVCVLNYHFISPLVVVFCLLAPQNPKLMGLVEWF
jgi:hypothetical protein